VAWDLRFPATRAIDDDEKPDTSEPRGVMAIPGKYTVTLSKQVQGKITALSIARTFSVERMRKGALEGSAPKETEIFWQKIAKLQRDISASSLVLRKTLRRVEGLYTALSRTPAAPGNLDKQLFNLRHALLKLDEKLNGNRSKQQIGEKNNPTIIYRLRVAIRGTMSSTYGPTPTHKRSLEIASEEFREFKKTLDNILNKQLPDLEKALHDTGAPWVR
jgi:hypothetical protein